MHNLRCTLANRSTAAKISWGAALVSDLVLDKGSVQSRVFCCVWCLSKPMNARLAEGSDGVRKKSKLVLNFGRTFVKCPPIVVLAQHSILNKRVSSSGCRCINRLVQCFPDSVLRSESSRFAISSTPLICGENPCAPSSSTL